MKIHKILFVVSLLSLTTSFAQSTDPLFSKQWAMRNDGQIHLKNISELERVQVKGIPGIDINWIDTRELKSDKKEIIVAVLDSGIDLNHPDLKDRLWYNKKLCEGATNTIAKACFGYNFLDNSTVLTDEIGHGTHVAGLIAANRNSIGIIGAADPRVKIMPLKVLNNQVNGFVYNGKVITDVIADAMTFAINNGAEVINLSLGWPKLVDLQKVKKAFELAEEKNVVVIAAAGNNNKDLPTFPCSYENVVCVGAIDNRGQLTDFTNHGSKIDVVAPGESIVSTFPQALESRVLRIKNYEIKRGSSQAAPYVTAAIANLKLLNPNLTNDQVRSLLFRSSKKLISKIDKKDQRFIKFGMLDMAELLKLGSEKNRLKLLNPHLKSLTEIKFKKSDLRFNFKLDFKNLSTDAYEGSVCFKSLSSAIEFDQNCHDVKGIETGKIVSLNLSGKVLDLTKDSHVLVQIQIDEYLYTASLVFNRDLSSESELKSFKIAKASFEDMGVISGDRKLSRMSRVFDKHKKIKFPEYFYLEKLKQSESNSVVSLLTMKNNDFVVEKITLPKVNKVLSIHRQDINFDGQMDYFIYTLSNKKDEIVFYLFDENLKPLFSKYSVWNFKLSTFEGLPIDGGIEKFEWLKVNNEVLGTILVPSLYKNYSMPESDNSKNIIDRVIGTGNHQYYLNPILKNDRIEIDLRVIDSVKMMKALYKKFGILGSFDAQSIVLLKPFPQTSNEAQDGMIRSMIALEHDGVVQLYELSLVLGETNIAGMRKIDTNKSVDQSLIYPILNTETGQITNESIFTTLLNRSTAEFLLKDSKSIDSLSELKNEWENPIISLSAIYSNQTEKTFLVESRNEMTALRSSGEKSSLPIYRDSSFPGQSFSETLTPVFSKGRPAIYINSTLIYGERLYAMVDSESEGFVRPLSLSINIPIGCVPLSPETFEKKNESSFAFICNESSKEVSLKFLPMSHL